ncbi:MAG: hydroxymethylglutaryl-CoA lyase [Bacteroidia bacterium]|jgi:hydroxymethylglutaryl-CoA lyase
MKVKIIECPRDAMQGLSWFVPTKAKIGYINSLLKVGFHTLDCGSFVSPKVIPQMRDTRAVLDGIDDNSPTKLSVIVANMKGALMASEVPQIQYLGYPFSVSETFQKRNTNSTMSQSLDLVKAMLDLADKSHKEMVVYISMGFGNPYNEDWSSALVLDWVGKIADLGVNSFSISDTVGVSNKTSIEQVFKDLQSFGNQLEFGAHFHTTPNSWKEKVDAAWKNGCRRFDGALKGYGGCPMAIDDLVGNMPTENLVDYFNSENIDTGLSINALSESMQMAETIFVGSK